MLIPIIHCTCLSGFAFACQASPDLILWFICFGKKLIGNLDKFLFLLSISMNKDINEANIYYIPKSCPAGVGNDEKSSGGI